MMLLLMKLLLSRPTLSPVKFWHSVSLSPGQNVLEHRSQGVEAEVPEWRNLSSLHRQYSPPSHPWTLEEIQAGDVISFHQKDTAGRQTPKIKSRGSGASQPPPLRRSKSGVELWNKNVKEHLNIKLLPQHRRSQQAFIQSGLSQPSPVVLSGTALHNFPAVQHQELAKAQSSLAFQQTSNTQPIPILYKHQLSQASGLGGSQLIDTHLLQVQQPGQTSFYNTAQSPSALQQVTVPIPGSQLSLPNFGSAGQPLIALPQSLQPPLQHTPPQPQAQSLSRPAQVGQPFRGLIPAGTQHSIIAGKMSEMDLKAFGSGIDVKPGTPPVTGRSTTPTSSPFRAASTSPNSQSNKMNTIVYQKQFQSAAVRMTQPFPPQFAPQILSQPNLVPPLVRAPHTNTFPAPVQRPPMALASQVPPQMTTGLMSHPRLPHVARGPCGSLSGVRGNQAQAAMKAEQDMKAKQRAEVLQSTQRFFSEQQQSKPTGGKIQKVGDSGNKAPEVMADSSGACQDKVEEKPNPAPATVPKPVRTGPIKPQAIKTEETKS